MGGPDVCDEKRLDLAHWFAGGFPFIAKYAVSGHQAVRFCKSILARDGYPENVAVRSGLGITPRTI